MLLIAKRLIEQVMLLAVQEKQILVQKTHLPAKQVMAVVAVLEKTLNKVLQINQLQKLKIVTSLA